MNGINLIPSHRLVMRRRAARVRMWMCIAPACVLLLSGSYGYLLGTWDTNAGEVQDRLSALEPEIAAREGENADQKRRLDEAKAALAAARSVGAQPNWGLLVAYVAQKLGEEAVLSDLVLEPVAAAPATGASPPPTRSAGKPSPAEAATRPASYRLTLSGLALTQEAVTRLALALSDPALFDRVKLVESKRSTFSGAEAVAFRIECAIDEQEGRTP